MTPNISYNLTCENGMECIVKEAYEDYKVSRSEHTVSFTSSLADGSTRFYRLTEGFSIIISTLDCKQPVIFSKEPGNDNLFIMSYDLSSVSIKCELEKNGLFLTRQKLSHTVLTFSNTLRFNLHPPVDTKISRLWILVDKKWLAQQSHFISRKNPGEINQLFNFVDQFKLRKPSLNEMVIARGILNYPFDTTPETIAYFDMKAIANELLSFYIKRILCGKPDDEKGMIEQPELTKLKEIKSFVKTNIFRETPITITELTQKFFISESSLKRAFKKFAGSSFTDFYNSERLKKAYELICTGKFQKIHEVAHKLGYKNASYFSKAFKETYNFYPSEVKNMIAA